MNIVELTSACDKAAGVETAVESGADIESLVKQNAEIESLVKQNAEIESLAERNAEIESLAERNAETESIAERKEEPESLAGRSHTTLHRRSLVGHLISSIKIRRPEFLVAEIPLIGIPALLAAEGSCNFFSFEFVALVVVVVALFNIGDMLNCLCDRETDTAEKKHLSRAVCEVGSASVLVQVVCTSVVALAITVLLADQTSKPYLIACTLLGIVLAASYSVAPVRFKSRGVLQVLWYWGALFFAPMLFALLALDKHRLNVLTLLIPAAFSAVQTGIVLVNNAEDYLEDRRQGVFTCSVELGLQRTMALAFWLTLAGGVSLFPLLVWSVHLHSFEVAPLVPLYAGGASWFFIVSRLRQLQRRITGSSERVAMVWVKREAKFVPAWLTVVAWSTLITLATMWWHS